MWPNEHREEREERRRRAALTELYNIDWRETSFVPAGDNPPARIVMWKGRDAEPELTDGEIAAILEEVEMGKAARPYAELHRIAKAELPELYRQSPSAAVAEISPRRPDLRDAVYRAQRS